MGFTIKIAICDDEITYGKNLEKVCRVIFKEYNISGFFEKDPEIFVFSSGRELIVSDQEYDILFLDIEMPEQDGISVKEYFEEHYRQTQIIFMTCHDERAMDAFGRNVVSFLVKPVSGKDLRRVLEKTLNDICGQVVELEENGELFFIPVRQIKYIEAQDKYTIAVTEKRNYLLRRTMKFWEEMLSGRDFCRIHKSYLFNLEYLEKSGDMVVLDDNRTVRISRKKKHEIMEQYKEFLRRKARMM